MIWYKKESMEINIPVYIQCDCCSKEYQNTGNDVLEYQEFVHIFIEGGYGSVFGDGSQMQCDICQHCAKILFGKFLRERRDEDANIIERQG